MIYTEIIREGIHTVNKNWQLIFVQLIAMMVSCISFFIIVGLPIAFAFIMFGLDLTEILKIQDIISAITESFGLLHKYFSIAVMIIVSLFSYVIFLILLWIFTISGTIGVLGNAVCDKGYRFSTGRFFEEAKKYLRPVFGFSIIISTIFIFAAFLLGMLGGGASALIDRVKGLEITLALFLSVFFALVLISVGLFLIFSIMSVVVYGFAHLFFHKSRPFDALKGSIRYIYSTPSSISFYAILLILYVIIGFIVLFIGSSFALIPIIGLFLSMPYQILSYLIQAYIGLIMLSSVFHYYHKTGYSSCLSLSKGDSDTYLNKAPEQVTPLDEKSQIQ